jgi:hypothetical protein
MARVSLNSGIISESTLLVAVEDEVRGLKKYKAVHSTSTTKRNHQPRKEGVLDDGEELSIDPYVVTGLDGANKVAEFPCIVSSGVSTEEMTKLA